MLFLGAALLLAATPGPGLFYVVGRTLAAGRTDGLASCFGTLLGGLIHVVAGAVGASALLMASAEAFFVLKFCGGIYLIYLAVQTWRSADGTGAEFQLSTDQSDRRAFRQAVIVEATNPKTSVFFLALVPQFVSLQQGHVATQFAILGCISVMLNTAADLVAVSGAHALKQRLSANGSVVRRLRRGSAILLGGIGIYFLVARRTPA